jgi:hypothetical protein
VRTEDDSLANVCREIALAVGAERLYCIVELLGARQVYAFDYEGYPVASAEARLPPDLLKTALDSATRETAPPVIRRAALDVRGAAAAVALELRSGAKLALVLEHRFGGSVLAALEDNDLGRWLTLCALAYRLEQRAAADKRTPSEGREAQSIQVPVEPVNPNPVVVAVRHVADSTRVPVEAHAPSRAPSKPEKNTVAPRVTAPAPDSDATDDDSFEEDSDAPEAEVSPEQRSESVSALQTSDWNISRAARQLGMTRHGLKKRMRRLGIRRPHG